MEVLVYVTRCLVIYLITWMGIRIIGKKSISQITSYDLAGILLLTTTAAEPLVYKIPSKAAVGVVALALMTLLIGRLSLVKRFYNFDAQPSFLIANGKVNKQQLKASNLNLPFLLSQLRLQGYARLSEIEFAILESNGQISVVPKSQHRPVKPSDMQIDTSYEGIALPLIIDSEIQYNNLKYANLTVDWLKQEVTKAGAKTVEEVFVAELDSQGQLYVDTYLNTPKTAPEF